MDTAKAVPIHDFWFGAPESDVYGQDRPEWFKASDDFDEACRQTMSSSYTLARAGALDHWAEQVISGVSLCLLLDQFPRNAFRGTAEAFATDSMARQVARRLIANSLDGDMIKVQREFVYMPFMHSEDLADQDYSVALFEALGDAGNLDFAIRHRDIIRRFGRFPHRNAILGRASTDEEADFLTQPNSSF